MLKKEYILAYRNRTATFLRLFSSFFFVLLIYLVKEGLSARYSLDPYFKDYPEPSRQVIEGIPPCVPKLGSSTCFTFIYCPSPDKSGHGYHPDADFKDLNAFESNVSCYKPQECLEMYRVHRVVRNIMHGNKLKNKSSPIPASHVVGFKDHTAMDEYLFANPNRVQGGYIFEALSDSAVTFVVQMNSTTHQYRGVWERPYLVTALPLQAQAHRAIAQLFNPDISMELATKVFAHPAFNIFSFEGMVSPFFLLGCKIHLFPVLDECFMPYA
jgi:hypothetical protein